MKVWKVFSFGIDNLEQAELPTPEPNARQVLVKVHAVSLNYRDLMVVEGKYNPKMELPRIPCSDGAGEIVAVGPGVTRAKVGDRIAGIFMQNWIDGAPTPAKTRGALGGDVDGMLAEYVVLGEEGVTPIPLHLSYEEAATLPCAAVTAWNAVVNRGAVHPGETVVIQGTGGVSIFALQFAKMLGARVLGTSSSDEKLEKAKALGLDAGVNYRKTPEWSRWVQEQTGGEGAELIVEVGGPGTFNHSLRAVKMGGTIAQIGVLDMASPPLEIAPILHKQVKIQGLYVGSRADFEAMNRGLAQHAMRPVIDRVFALEDVQAAIKHLRSGAHFGKIVVRLAG
jgi:NADPH:quinone reductase-like Zn-dependent oxidoreductase